MRKILAFVIVVLVLFYSLAGCEDLLSESSTAPTEPTVISIPGTLVAENFTFKIVSAELFSSVTLNAGIDFNIDAEEGKQILILCIDATNTSSSARNLGAFNTYVDDTVVLPHNVLGKYGDRILMGGGVDPGKTMKAYVMYQVPMDWEFFELSYTDTLTLSNSGSVRFSREDATGKK